MKHIIFIMLFFLSGCATLTEDTAIDDSFKSSWSVEDTYYGFHFQHKCNGEQSASVGIDKILSREGKLYFIFFILPIHSAELSDQPYSGIKITTRFPGQHKACSVGDVLLNIGGEALQPETAAKSYLNDSDCEYNWSPKIQENGKFTISFSGINQCKVPPIEFRYETGSSYNYQSLGA